MKGITVTKTLKEIKFEGIWGEQEAKKCYQKQQFTKHWNDSLLSSFSSKIKIIVILAKISQKIEIKLFP